mgnify:CR=1 FL=1
MQKNKILKRIDRIIFQAIVMGDNLTADDVLRLGNMPDSRRNYSWLVTRAGFQ